MKIERATPFLFANLGSEITRFFGLKRRNMHEEARTSIERALGIVDSIVTSNMHTSASREAMILRKIIIDLVNEPRQFTVDEQELQSFFLPFARKVIQNMR